MMKISGKTAVVIGGGSGIGKSIALALANEGANVVIADIEKQAADEVSHEIAEYGVDSFAMRVDVSKFEEVQALANAVYEKYSSVDILCNNAGVTLRPFRAHWDCSLEDWRWIMNINFWGVLHGHMAFVPRMIKTDSEKHIVNTSSMASLWSIAGHAAYTASKAAIDGLSLCAREELKRFNIGVSILHPSTVRTRIVTSDRLMTKDQRIAQTKVKPWGDYYTNSLNKKPSESGLKTNNEQAERDPDIPSGPDEYITPKYVGMFVVEGILKNKPHITTHPLPLDRIQERFNGILDSVPTFPNL